MSFDLRNDAGEEFTFNNSGWRCLRTFAEAHGFHWPATEDGEDSDALTASQASDLADVIESALVQGPPAALALRVPSELTKLLVIPWTSPLFRSDPIDITVRTIDYWRQFLQYARMGGFTVEF